MAGSTTTPTTLVELMGRRVSTEPDASYFHLYDETVTYGQLWNESARYAAGLRRAGIDRGDKVCLIYPTCKEFFFTFFGALRLGAVPVPLYPTLGVEATAGVFRDSEAKAVAPSSANSTNGVCVKRPASSTPASLSTRRPEAPTWPKKASGRRR